MKVLKRILVLALVLTMSSALIACGAKQATRKEKQVKKKYLISNSFDAKLVKVLPDPNLGPDSKGITFFKDSQNQLFVLNLKPQEAKEFDLQEGENYQLDFAKLEMVLTEAEAKFLKGNLNYFLFNDKLVLDKITKSEQSRVPNFSLADEAVVSENEQEVKEFELRGGVLAVLEAKFEEDSMVFVRPSQGKGFLLSVEKDLLAKLEEGLEYNFRYDGNKTPKLSKVFIESLVKDSRQDLLALAPKITKVLGHEEIEEDNAKYGREGSENPLKFE